MPIPRAPGSTSSRRSCGLILSILTRRPAAWYPVLHHQRRTAMLDLVIRGGDVVTPQGVGRWDVAIEGERIVALGLPEHGLQAGRVIDASGRIVVPGGIEQHTHLAHFISMQPEENLSTLGPEEDTRGMVFGGTTTHVDFCFVRPGTDVQQVIETRAARWKGNSYADYSFHVALQGQLPLKVFDQIPEAIQAGFPSFKVFTVDVLPPHPKRIPIGWTSGGYSWRWRRSPRTGASWPFTPRTRTSCSSCTRSSARKSRPTAGCSRSCTTSSRRSSRSAVRSSSRRTPAPASTSSTPPPARAWTPWPKRGPTGCRSTPRRSITTPASPPRTTRPRAASATTHIRRSSIPRTRRRSGTGSCATGSRRRQPTSFRRRSS